MFQELLSYQMCYVDIVIHYNLKVVLDPINVPYTELGLHNPNPSLYLIWPLEPYSPSKQDGH